MAKKRQKDFHKTQLRVGKSRPHGQNVTNTSFKSKQIVTRTQLSSPSPNASLNVLINQASNKNVKIKKEALHKIEKYVFQNSEDLPLDFMTILKKVGVILSDDDLEVRRAALNLTNACISYLSDAQMNCFLPTVLSYLNCMMTHYNNAIRQDSLMLLDSLLQSYPDLLSHSVKILKSLLGMISNASVNKDSASRKRKLSEVIGENVTSRDWRMDVLSRMVVFLEALSGHQEDLKESDEVNQVYMDNEKPLFLPIYTRSGLRPLPLVHPWHNQHTCKEIDSAGFKNIMYYLAPLLSEMIKGEIAEMVHSKSTTFSQKSIEHLAVIVHILCCWEDWMDEIDNHPSEFDDDLRKFIASIIQDYIIKGFPFPLNLAHKATKGKHKCGSMELNMGICYLYSIYYSKLQLDPKKFCRVFAYFTDTLCKGLRMSHPTLTRTLKSCKNFFNNKHISIESKIGILLGLCGMMEDQEDRVCRSVLRSFIMEVTLNLNYIDLYNADGMDHWFGKILPKELTDMIEHMEIDKKFFKYLRQIYTMGFPAFLKYFDDIAVEKIIKLLTFPDEDVQETTAHFLTSLPKITPELLQDLYHALRDPRLPLRISIRIIRSLHYRFSQPNVSTPDQIQLLIFLMNVICDSAAIDTEDSTIVLREAIMLRPVDCQYAILPTEHWKYHSMIYDVCIDYICKFVQEDTFAQVVLQCLSDFMSDAENIPIHCAIAFFRLQNRISFMDCRDMDLINKDLLYASLFALYRASSEFTDERAIALSFPELQESFQIKNCFTMVLDKIKNLFECVDSPESLNIEFILRLYLFLISSNALSVEHGPSVMNEITKLSMLCKEDSHLFPLIRIICEFFEFC